MVRIRLGKKADNDVAKGKHTSVVKVLAAKDMFATAKPEFRGKTGRLLVMKVIRELKARLDVFIDFGASLSADVARAQYVREELLGRPERAFPTNASTHCDGA